MKTEDITPIIDKIYERVEAHKLAPGSYARYLWQDERNSREMGENEYGCADAANILYTIGRFPSFDEEAERKGFVKVLRNMQRDDGTFFEHTHHPIHTTAHCIAALELFDAAPLKPCRAFEEYKDSKKLFRLLEGLDWANNPWDGSHIGAGIYVAMKFTGASDKKWEHDYFDWFWENTDARTGFWTGGLSESECKAPIHYYMAGAFHFLFDHEYAHMPLRYPERMIDSCLEMYDAGLLPPKFGTYSNFIEIDWIFCLSRASRQTAYRFNEVQEHLEALCEKLLDFWKNCDWEREESVNDMHMLFGGVCGLAELQSVLRGKLISDKPLRLVLDRRPFI